MAQSTPGPVIGTPSTLILPEDRASSPPIQRNSVDLPQPDAPTKVTNSLLRTVRFTSCKAVMLPSPKVLPADSILILVFIMCPIFCIAMGSSCDEANGTVDRSPI